MHKLKKANEMKFPPEWTKSCCSRLIDIPLQSPKIKLKDLKKKTVQTIPCAAFYFEKQSIASKSGKKAATKKANTCTINIIPLPAVGNNWGSQK